MDTKDKAVVFWFRRDLRWDDNVALYYALRTGLPVVPIFIFDVDILNRLATYPKDRRVQFIYMKLKEINDYFWENFNSGIIFFLSTPKDAFKILLEHYDVESVFFNYDYDPYTNERDKQIINYLQKFSINCYSYRDFLIFEPKEIISSTGTPFRNFSKYSKVWKIKYQELNKISYPSESYLFNLYKFQSKPLLFPYENLGFVYEQDFCIPKPNLDETTLRNYHLTRDFPYLEKGTTRLSHHLRFGTISIRKVVSIAEQFNPKLLDELIWREFSQSILYHFPWTISENFNRKFDFFKWETNEKFFEKWMIGETGFPLIDAGMRELNATGYLHNRVRMVVANFLTKILKIDWRLGESFFREKLLDYELASNVGNWQWCAGTGVDSAPYFRIFSPELQRKKFDPENVYVKKWIPDFEEGRYLNPIVSFEEQRNKYLERVKCIEYHK